MKSRVYKYLSFLFKVILNCAFKQFFLIVRSDTKVFSETFLPDTESGFTSKIRSSLHAKHSPIKASQQSFVRARLPHAIRLHVSLHLQMLVYDYCKDHVHLSIYL